VIGAFPPNRILSKIRTFGANAWLPKVKEREIAPMLLEWIVEGNFKEDSNANELLSASQNH